MPRPVIRRRIRTTVLLLAAGGAAVAVPLAASGESQVTRPGIAGVIRTPTAPVPALRTAADRADGREAAPVLSPAAVVTAQHRVQRHGLRAAAGGGSRPCALVSRARAQALLGTRAVTVVQAPQGPTCLFRAAAGPVRQQTTLVVQATPAGALLSHLQDRRTLTLAGHRAFCGRFGTSELYVPLDHGHVLSLSGPCAVTQGFAAAALRQLGR